MAESYCTVLLIDGSTTDRAFFRRCLEQDEIYSYEILEAELPEAGLEWGQPPPNVILLDAGLPDRDVLQLLGQFNHLSWSQIVLLIEQDDRALITQAMQHGAADYLVKPDLSADLLRRTVRSLVKQSRLQQQLAQQQATIATLMLQSANRDAPLRQTPDRQQTELSLRQTNQLLSAIIQAIPDLLVCMDQNGHYHELIGSEYLHVLLPNKPIQETTVYDVLPVHLAEQRLHYARLALETNSLQVYEQTLEINGQLCHEEVRVVPLVDREVLIIIRDITERKRSEAEHQQAEAALRRSEERWQLAIEGSNDGIWDQDLITGKHFLSPRCLEMLGYTYAEIDSFEKWFAQVHPADRQALQTTLQAYLDRQTPIYAAEYRIRCKEGSYKWLLVRGKAFWDEAGTPLRLIGSTTDITLRRQAELELQQLNTELEQRVQQRNQALIQSERDLRTIFNNVYDAILIHDLDGTILDLNDRALELWEATREQLLGGSVADISAPDAPLERLPEIFQRVHTGETLRFEWRDRRLSNNAIFDVEVSLRKVTLNNRTVFIAGVRDISDRKQAEQQLQSERLRLQLALEAANMGTWESSQFMGIWSEHTEAIFGYAPGTFPGDRETFLKLVHRDDQERVFSALEHSFATQSPYNVEYRIHRQDGELRWVAVNGKVVDSEDGSGLRLVGVAFDSTDRKHAEEALQSGQLRLQLALNAAQMGSWSCSLQTGMLIWSDRAQEIFGFIPGTFPGDRETFLALVHPDDLERVLQAIAHTFETGSPYDIEYRIHRLDGEVRWIATWGMIPQDALAAEPQLIGVVCDITDRKQAELALSEAQQFAQSIAENTPNIIYIYDLLNQRNLYTNQEVFTLLGYTTEELQAMGSDLLTSVIHPDDWHLISALQTNVVHANDNQIFELEYRVRHRDGDWRWLFDRVAAFKRDATGQVIQYIGSAQDITERKRLEQELRQINAELESRVEARTNDLRQAMEAAEAANRAKSAFLANMSHELRTPLNAILGFAQLLSRDFTMAPDKRQQLSIINRSGQHLLNLINDILEMSKIEAGRINFAPTSFDLYTMLNTLKDMLQIRAIEKGLQLIVERDPSLPRYIKTDEHKLRQILINLVGNAIKFTPAGKVVLHIRQTAEPPNGQREVALPDQENPIALNLQFAVVDTGIGIDPDELEHLFEPFIQSSSRHVSQEGTGLGLPISRQFVQLMGGNLTVDSTPGVGSTFAFTIPVQRANDTNWANHALPRHILSLAPNQPSYRMLVVEDNDPNRLLLVRLLQSVGFEVQAANNGQEAIALWETWQPHLIWMDMRMPIMNGYEATRQIRSLEAQWQDWENRGNGNDGGDGENKRSPTKIIALTASAFEEDRARVLNVGCNDFVRKPFQEAELLEKIAEHLGVQYFDAEPDEAVEFTTASDLFDVIAALQALPTTLLTQLHQATIQLDSQQLSRAIAQLAPTHSSLATLLTEKLENFDFEQILQLLQTVQ